MIHSRALFATLPLTALLVAAPPALAQITPKPADQQTAWGNQGDGTYVNPVLPADYSDIDAIRVGDDYYAMSSTFQFSPGVVILHSRDLVSWTIAGHAVDDISKISPEMNWDKMNRYGRGIWAGAMRYHDGKFWIYFGTPDEGFFVTAAKNVAGPWEPATSVMNAKGWDDCCPFWDDDGQGYFVCTNFSDTYKIHLFKMTPDGKNLLPDSDKVIHQSRGSEANKLYKFNGMYYHFFSEVRSEGRTGMMERAKTLDGPWEIQQLQHVNKNLDKEPNQGGFIQVPNGSWWFVTHQGTGTWEGRTMSLLPVTWTDGWPIIGKPGADGIGNMVWQEKIPVAGQPVAMPQTDDDFADKVLGLQWEWNYQSRAEKWSLTERPGFLRLHAFKTLQAENLLKAGNTLTQRTIRVASSEATIKLDIRGMADGTRAGLCHFAKTWSWIGIAQNGATRNLTFVQDGRATPGPAVTGEDLWLRSAWNSEGKSSYAYSLDGKEFTPFGEPYQMTWGSYRGDRIGIFCFNNKEVGFVDVDWFRSVISPPGK